MAVQYENTPVDVKRVYFTGTDTLYEGYALNYDWDDGTASAIDIDRRTNVEKPATANLEHFAGVVHPGCGGRVGPCWLAIITAGPCNVQADQTCVIGVTHLATQDGSFALGASANDAPPVALALQTVDRGETDGLVFSELKQPGFWATHQVVCETDSLVIKTETDTKNVRINSRDYTATSGDVTAVQSKPNMSVTGTVGVTAIEVSPRFASGIAGSKCVGIMSNPILKGAAGGNLSSDFRCYEGKLESDSGSTRTVTGVSSVLHAMNAMHGTCTGGVFPINISAAGGNLAWTGFARAAASGAGGIMVSADGMAKDPDTHNEAGYIKYYVGTTEYQVPMYASS